MKDVLECLLFTLPVSLLVAVYCLVVSMVMKIINVECNSTVKV